jgi:hypothetical protein
MHRVELVLSFQCCRPYWVRFFSVLYLRVLRASVVSKLWQINTTETQRARSIIIPQVIFSSLEACPEFLFGSISSPPRRVR